MGSEVSEVINTLERGTMRFSKELRLLAKIPGSDLESSVSALVSCRLSTDALVF